MRHKQGLFIEAVDSENVGRWRIRVIRAGLSGNNNFYPKAVLREAVPLFDGARVFVKADAEHIAGHGKDFRNLIGRLAAPQFVDGAGPNDGEIQATLQLIEANGVIATKIREAWNAGMADLFGFSIDAVGKTRVRQSDGRQIREAVSFTKVNSVDLIVEPGAGGQIINFMEAQAMDHLSPAQIELAITKSNLPPIAREQLINRFAEAQLTEEQLSEAIKTELEYLAKFTESGTVRGLGEDRTSIRLVEGRAEKSAKMLDAFFDPKDSSISSIRECYVAVTGDTRITGNVRNCDQALMREALNAASFADVLGDAISRRMVADYRQASVYDVWRGLATVAPVRDFRTQERTRFGGYGDLPAVAEGGPYAPMTSPTDEKATYAISKKGGTEELTLEMIANDDAGVVQRIPQRMARAAKRTLSKFVLDFLRTNPQIYDGLTLFHATHNNLGTDALAAASVAAARMKMIKQTELSSQDRIAVGPKYLWVPPDLEESAVDLFRRNTNNDKTFVQSLTLEVMPVWYWTDATDWYLSADPLDIPSVEIGFLNSQEEPQLFVQDNPTTGSVFSHDKLTYKIRHVYGGNVMDYRGLFGAVVA